MDPFSRRVYFSVAGLLLLLWLGMLGWAVHLINPGLLSLASAPAAVPPSLSTQTADYFRVPGYRFSVYHTSPGDTFASVSKKFGLRETSLRSLNQANDDTEPEDDSSLLVPSQDGIFHVLRPGQGLTDIARAYEIPIKDLLTANHLRGDFEVQPGQVLYLPGAAYLPKKDLRWVSLESLRAKTLFLKPTTGRFADGFGMRLHPITHQMAFHEGLDLAPGLGAKVFASQDGKVLFANLRAGYGRLIVLDHGEGLTSWYAHLDKILVKPGQTVKKGDLIGKVGDTGRTTGPHLHFEVRLNGKPQNPLLYLVQ